MGIIYWYEEQGQGDGRTWYVAAYPLGATRYYVTAEQRERATNRYVAAIRYSGGACVVVPA